MTEEIDLRSDRLSVVSPWRKTRSKNTFSDGTSVHLCTWSTIPLIFTPQRKFTGNNLGSSNHKMINWQLNYNLREGSLLQILHHISYYIYFITSLLKIQRYAVTHYSKGLLPTHNPICTDNDLYEDSLTNENRFRFFHKINLKWNISLIPEQTNCQVLGGRNLIKESHCCR